MRHHGALICSLVALCLLATVPSPARGCGISGAEGSYKRSCRNCSITGTILSCDCNNGLQAFVHTSIDLSDCRSLPEGQDPLSNKNGQLFCRHCSVPGACCLPDASCAIKTFNECESVGTFKGDNRACADVSCPQQTQTEIHWTNPDGGDFGVADNWNPQQVPTFNDEHSDTAIFDLTGSGSVAIRATNNAVGRWIIRHMFIHLIGPAQVLGTATGQFNFVVDDGGSFLLDNSIFFSTTNGMVGQETGAESTVLVTGAATVWEVRGPLAIGGRRAGTVKVDENGLLDAQQSITVGNTVSLGTGGTLQVDGTLRVESGGLVFTPHLTLNKGSITVRGGSAVGNSLLEVASDLDIGGQAGSGSVLIEDGGVVTAPRVLVGDLAGTGGETVTISGRDNSGLPSKLSVGGSLHVRGNAQTQIEVKDGGNLRTSGPARVGENLAVGKVIVHGKSGDNPSSWDAIDNVFIGGQLTASELIVEDGAIVTGSNSKSMVLGSQTGDIGKVSVSDGDTILNVGTLVVGSDGRGELTIDGGVVRSTTGVVGRSSAAGPPVPGGGPGKGFVTMGSTPVSKWHVTGDCFVGVDEPGTVTLVGQQIIGGVVGGAFLTIDGSLTVGTQGKILGVGRLTAGHVFNQGFMSPGLSPGTIVIDGEYEQAPDGALRIEAAGLEQGQFDVLQITGTATLAGKLELRFIDGYLPKAGDSFDFLEVGGTMAGDFAQMTFPNLAPGFDAELSTTPDGKLRLTALTDGVLRCAGDCDGGDTVSIDELLTMVNIALGNLSADRCPAGDTSGNEEIRVDELLGAVNKALSGCR